MAGFEQEQVTSPDILSERELRIRFLLDQALTSGDDALCEQVESDIIFEDLTASFNS